MSRDELYDKYWKKLRDNMEKQLRYHQMGLPCDRFEQERDDLIKEMQHKLKNAKVTEILKDL